MCCMLSQHPSRMSKSGAIPRRTSLAQTRAAAFYLSIIKLTFFQICLPCMRRKKIDHHQPRTRTNCTCDLAHARYTYLHHRWLHRRPEFYKWQYWHTANTSLAEKTASVVVKQITQTHSQRPLGNISPISSSRGEIASALWKHNIEKRQYDVSDADDHKRSFVVVGAPYLFIYLLKNIFIEGK